MPHTLENVKHEGRGCRHLLLHSKASHIVLLLLLIIDGLICLTCGVLETEYLAGKADDCKKYVNRCMPHRRLDALDTIEWDRMPLILDVDDDDFVDDTIWNARRLSGNSSSSSSNSSSNTSSSSSGSSSSSTTSSSSSTTSSSSSSCSGHPHFGNHDLHDAEKYLAYVSIGILSIFLIEQFALIYELRMEYLKPMLLLDLFVITVSLVLEILITNMAVGGLIVVARAWRFARVGHGVFEGEEIAHEIVEEDDTYATMKQVFDQLSTERWREIKKALSAECLELSDDEKKIADQIGRSPAVAMRAMAFAFAYEKHRDRKHRYGEGQRPQELGNKAV